MYGNHWLAAVAGFACIAGASAGPTDVQAAGEQKDKAPSGPAREAALPVDANIGTITRLARQLKIAQMERDLREAQKAAAAVLPAQAPATTSGASAAEARPPAALPWARPQVGQIGGMGGALRAYLVDGRELQLGTKLILTDRTTWTVRGIRPTNVIFDVCPDPTKPQQSKPARRARQDFAPSSEIPICTIQNVAPFAL